MYKMEKFIIKNRNDYKLSLFNVLIPFEQKYVVYNTYSGSIILFDNNIDEFIKSCSDDEFVKLITENILVRKELNEVNKLIIDRNKSVFNPNPKTLFFEICPTMECQANCVYCFENKMMNKIPMSNETAEDTIMFITNLIDTLKPERLIVRFFGGEPLLEKDIIYKIGNRLKEYCESASVMFSSEIFTNGILLEKNYVESLVSSINLKKVQITIDGTKEVYKKIKGIDAFDTVIDNIEKSADIVDIIIRLNVFQENKSDISKTIEYISYEKNLKDRITMYVAQVENVEGCNISNKKCMSLNEYSSEKHQIYAEYLQDESCLKVKHLIPHTRRKFCGMECLYSFIIKSDGSLYKCSRAIANSKYCVGNVVDGIQYNDVFMKYYEPLNQKCINKQCSLLPICYGGCTQERVFSKFTPNCSAKMKEIREGIILACKKMKS